MTRSIALFAVAALAFTGACKKKEDAKPAPSEPAGAAKPTEPTAPVAPADKPVAPPTEPAAPPPAAAIDPATFAPADVTKVAALAKVTVKAPPGATVTPDDPHFGEKEPTGVTITAGDFNLHIWRGTLGGERDGTSIKAQGMNGKYAETLSNEKLVEYTITSTADGKVSYGFIRPIATPLDGSPQVLCGPTRELASADGFAAYRAACDTAVLAK